MSGRYTIGQLARRAGIPATTLRYYERIGLLKPEDRSEGNYRLYSDESLRTLRFIRAAQAIGFTLDDVRMLLAVPGSSAAACRVVQPLLEERLSEVARRLKDLRHVRHVLKAALEKCRETEQAGCCHVMDVLRKTS